MGDLYLVTCEDEDGMWFDDPIAGSSADEARAIARKKWPIIHYSKALILYRCSQVEELDTIRFNPNASSPTDSQKGVTSDPLDGTDA